MEFKCQESAMLHLAKLAKNDRHSILIEGPRGCGKSYLAKHYAELLSTEDYQEVSPKVEEIRTAIQSAMQVNNTVVMCIENIDTGVLGASYSLLKFLEEPASNVYIVVTCQNIQKVPDTIISRSAVVSAMPPTLSDLQNYAEHINFDKYIQTNSYSIWQCARSFRDVDDLLSMNTNQLAFFDNLPELSKFTGPVSSISWSLSHYPDNSEAPLHFVILMYLRNANSSWQRLTCIECLDALSNKRIASHAVIAKFVFQNKYCE